MQGFVFYMHSPICACMHLGLIYSKWEKAGNLIKLSVKKTKDLIFTKTANIPPQGKKENNLPNDLGTRWRERHF